MNTKFLHIVIMLILGSLFSGSAWSQDGFKLPDEIKRGKLKFKLVNNLIVIPMEINDVELSFILDTGVTSTLLFGATKDSLRLKNTSIIKLRGLGKGDPVEAIKSQNNAVRVGKALDSNHTVYTIFDGDLNLSKRMGVPIHGILGYEFFRNFVVSINYRLKTIKYYSPEHFNERKKRGYTSFPIQINRKRPFIDNVVINEGEESLMLIDIGSSDSVWVLDDDVISGDDENYFTDFLGLGLSGNIYGKRSKVSNVGFGEFNFNDVNVAVPESTAIVNSILMKERKGSLGAQLMKRFNIIFNYPKGELSLKKNANYKDPFYYNMSGLTLEHYGISTIRTIIGSNKSDNTAQNRNLSGKTYSSTVSYEIALAPNVVVADVKTNSVAHKVDIRVGDKITAINGKPAHEYKLYEISSLFSSKDGKLINLRIERRGERFKKKFYLKKLF